MTDIQKTEEALSPSDKLTILYEDNHIIVVLKPQNLASCPDESGDENLLDLVREYIRTAYNKPGNVYVGLVHRLDRPTGGVMVFAKTSKAAGRLGEQMKTGDFEKKYLTVLNGCPHSEQGTLVNYLKKNTVNNMVYLCTQGTDGAKLASLDYHRTGQSSPRSTIISSKRRSRSPSATSRCTRAGAIRSACRWRASRTPSTAICAMAASARRRASSPSGRIP